jgi:hypothetical protein
MNTCGGLSFSRWIAPEDSSQRWIDDTAATILDREDYGMVRRVILTDCSTVNFCRHDVTSIRRRSNMSKKPRASKSTSGKKVTEENDVNKPVSRQRVATTHLMSIAGYMIDSQTGLPVTRVPVFLVSKDKSKDSYEETLGFTNDYGFVSWAVDTHRFRADTFRVIAADGTEHPVRPTPQGASASVTNFIARVDVSKIPSALIDGADYMGASYSPAFAQLVASPQSFVRTPQLKLGQEDCLVPIPATVAPIEFRFAQLIRRTTPPPGVVAVASPPVINPSAVDILDLLPAQEPVLLYGQRMVYRQTWRLIGQSLGDIVYSLPLAPLESVNIAVVDWSRSDTAARQEEIVASESLNHNLNRDRTIRETVETAISEYQGGFAVIGGIGAAGGPAAGGVGAGTSHSWGNRNLTGESVQDLADAVTQASEAVRSLRSTVIVQSRQTERDVIETRTVSNYNQTRAMTVQYYEVLRHFRVETSFAEAQPVVFIPFVPIRFDRATTKRFRHILISNLLDPRARAWFDALERANEPNYGSVGGGETATIVETGDVIENNQQAHQIERLQIEFTTGDQQTIGFVSVLLGLRDGSWIIAGTVGYAEDWWNPPLREGNKHAIDSFHFVTDHHNHWEREHTAIYLADVERVRVRWTQHIDAPFDGWKFKGIRILYALVGGQGLIQKPLFEVSAANYLMHFKGKSGNWTSSPFAPELPEVVAPSTPAMATPTSLSASTTSSAVASALLDLSSTLDPSLANRLASRSVQRVLQGHPGPNDRAYFDDLRKEKLLLSHLNANRMYYSRCVWLAQDPDERVHMLVTNAWLKSKGILDHMDFNPVGVSGSHVAFPFHGTLPFAEITIKDLAPEATERNVTLPSRGVFAEIHLSHCSAREERDPSRMYDANEIILPKAPDITGIQPGSRHAVPDLTPASLPSPIVNIQSAPSAPDPVGLAAALKVLGQGDVFRDMSTASEVSSLLNGLISGSIKGDAVKPTASRIQQALSGAAAGSGGSTKHPALSGNAKDTHDRLKLLEQSDLPAAEKALIKRNILDPGSAFTLASSLESGFVAPDLSVPGDQVSPFLWRDLIEFKVPQDVLDMLASRGMSSLSLGAASGALINLDYFPIRITKLPIVDGQQLTADQFLEFIRRNLHTNLMISTTLGKFAPYAEEDKQIWFSDNPYKAVLKIDLIGPDNAAVVCAESAVDHWIFHTIATGYWPPFETTGAHPVSGQRMFGYWSPAPEEFVFYTRGADRATGIFDSLLAEQIFGGGAAIWATFQAGVAGFVNSNGGEAAVPRAFSGRYSWHKIIGALRAEAVDTNPI